MRVSSAQGAQGGPLQEHCPSSSLNAPGNPGPARTQAQFWLQPRPGSGSGEDTGQCLPQEYISGKGRRNHWSQEAATQTGLLPGCRWRRPCQVHHRAVPSPFPVGWFPCLLLLPAWPLPDPRCPCLKPSEPSWCPGAGSGAELTPPSRSRPMAVGTSKAGAAEAGLWGGCSGCSPQAGVLPAALQEIPAEPSQPRDLTHRNAISPELPRLGESPRPRRDLRSTNPRGGWQQD